MQPIDCFLNTDVKFMFPLQLEFNFAIWLKVFGIRFSVSICEDSRAYDQGDFIIKYLPGIVGCVAAGVFTEMSSVVLSFECYGHKFTRTPRPPAGKNRHLMVLNYW